MTLLSIFVGLALAGGPDAVVPVVAPVAGATPAISQSTGYPLDPEGFAVLPDPIWSAERGRRCSLITLAEAPQLAGEVVTAKLRYSKGGATFATWHFYDQAGNLTLTQQGSTCFTNIKLKQEPGLYRFDFTLPLDTVAFDPALNTTAMAQPAFQACHEEYPDKISSDVVVSTVVDNDGTTFTNASTRNQGNLRDCLGKALQAWVEPQVAAGSFPLAAPAVVKAWIPLVRPAP